MPQVAAAEARGQEVDEAAPEVQAARAAERNAAEQLVAHEAQVHPQSHNSEVALLISD